MKLIETGSFPISEIEIGDRLRGVDEGWAEGIAASVKETGLQNPVQLLKIGNKFRLVAGAHRVRAYELLGITEIPAKIHEPETDKPELELRLAEIDENLSRRNLSALDRAVSIATRRTILDELHGETRGRKKKEDNLSLFSVNQAVADKLGLHPKTVARALAIFRGLSEPTRKRLAGTPLADHQSQLSALADLSHDNQTRALDLVLAEEPKARTVQDAILIIEKRPKAEKDTQAELIERVDKAWWGMDGRTKKQMLLKLRDYGVIITADQVVTGARAKPKG